MEDLSAFPGRENGPEATHPAVELNARARWEVLIAILLGLFLSALDQTIVGTALPKIITDLNGNDLYTWVVTAYLLTSTVTVPVYGKLSDLIGRKPVLIAGIALFLAGSFLSGLSQSMGQLILFRGIQGLGAGSLFPVSLAVIGDLFTPAERGKYQGLFGAVFGISALIGPALGGFLTDTISWHWVFYVNMPVGAVALFIIWRALPTFRRKDVTSNIDYAGVAVFTAAVVPFLVGLTNKQTGEWTDPMVGGLMALGVVLGLVFIWIESRAKEPIVPLGLFRIRTYTMSIMSTFFVTFGFFGAIVFLPRFLQFVRGTSATESGYQMFPFLIGLIATSVLAGQYVSRTGRYKWMTVLSLVVTTVGLYLDTQLRAGTDLPVLWLWMFIIGMGLGPSLAVFTIVVQNAVPFDKLGVATSNLTFFRQIGGTIGLTIAGTIFGDTLRDEAPRQLIAAGVPQQLVTQFNSHQAFSSSAVTGVGVNMGQAVLAQVPAQFQAVVAPFVPSIVKGIYEAFSIAVAQTFWVGVAATGIAVVASLFIPELPLRSTLEQPARRPETVPAAAPAMAAAAVAREAHPWHDEHDGESHPHERHGRFDRDGRAEPAAD